MSHDMFKHIVALNTYTEPFLALKNNDQRAIIEQLLGITLLSEKADLLREQIRINRDRLTEENARISAVKDSNEKIKENIERLHSRRKAWIAQNKQDCEKLAKAIKENTFLNEDIRTKNEIIKIMKVDNLDPNKDDTCLLYTSPSPRDLP